MGGPQELWRELAACSHTVYSTACSCAHSCCAFSWQGRPQENGALRVLARQAADSAAVDIKHADLDGRWPTTRPSKNTAEAYKQFRAATTNGPASLSPMTTAVQ